MMMRVSRRAAFAGAAGMCASIGIPRFPAGAAEFNYKWGLFAPLSHPMGARSKEAVDKISQASDGRVEIKLFPDYQLGTDSSMLTQLRSGALEFQTIADAILAEVVPVTGITATPFVFRSHEQGWKTIDGPLGTYVRNEIRKATFYAFDKGWDAGFRILVTQTRPVNKPDDLKGLRLRALTSQVAIATWKALGASPTTTPSDQIYVSLQTHLIDGLETPLVVEETFKLYEVTKYVALTNHAWTSMTTIGNVDAMRRLPKDLSTLVDRNVNEAAIAARTDIVRLDATLTATLKGQGVVFNQPDIEAFRSTIRASGLYGEWARTQYNAEVWSLLEKAVGKLT